MAWPKAPGPDLLPRARFAPPENRFPVKIRAPKPAPDRSLDQALGKYR
jgi:hypothetical protein